MRKLGAVLLIGGIGVASGYLLYWFFAAVADFIPIALKVAIAIAAIGFILLLASIFRDRCKASEEEQKLKEVER